MIKALPIQTDLKPKYYLAKLPSVGIIEDSIFANYKTALEQGDLDQARKAVKFAQELKTMTESGDFVDYPNSSTPEALPPSNFANPFPYKYYESQGVVVMGNAAINLTPKENKLFALFAKNESSGNVIRVITKEQILNTHNYVKNYIDATNEDMLRVWFARSDPALNYGSLPAVLMVKIALQRLKKLEEESSRELLPIIGMGSSPFRGNFKPSTASQILKGYPSVQTFTLQSAYKYDNPISEVLDSIEYIDSISRKDPLQIDEELALKYIDIVEKEYTGIISELAPTINHVSRYLPERRMRKTHTGLFGYSRATQGVKLPRAIKFCGALYSIGLPPEILGLSALMSQDIDKIKTFYSNIEFDMTETMQYFNRENLGILPESVRKKVLGAIKLFDYVENPEHYEATTKVVEAMRHNDHQAMNDWILKAAEVRKFLG